MLSERPVAQPGRAGDVRRRTRLTPDVGLLDRENKAGAVVSLEKTPALGLTAEDAEDLRALLLQAVKTTDVQLGRRDAYGQRSTVDILLTWCDKQAMVRSEWMSEHDSDTPRLTTCDPLGPCEAMYGTDEQTP